MLNTTYSSGNKAKLLLIVAIVMVASFVAGISSALADKTHRAWDKEQAALLHDRQRVIQRPNNDEVCVTVKHIKATNAFCTQSNAPKPMITVSGEGDTTYITVLDPRGKTFHVRAYKDATIREFMSTQDNGVSIVTIDLNEEPDLIEVVDQNGKSLDKRPIKNEVQRASDLAKRSSGHSH